jgi:hypothetical protein
VKHTTSFCRVKHFLNLVYVATAIRAVEADNQAAITNAKKAIVADEVRAYRDQMWFESHARHSFFESPDGKVHLCTRSAPQTDTAPYASRRRVSPSRTVAKPREQNDRPPFYGTKYGRIQSLPTSAPYRRGAAV